MKRKVIILSIVIVCIITFITAMAWRFTTKREKWFQNRCGYCDYYSCNCSLLPADSRAVCLKACHDDAEFLRICYSDCGSPCDDSDYIIVHAWLRPTSCFKLSSEFDVRYLGAAEYSHISMGDISRNSGNYTRTEADGSVSRRGTWKRKADGTIEISALNGGLIESIMTFRQYKKNYRS